jgi:hypothetical protein
MVRGDRIFLQGIVQADLSEKRGKLQIHAIHQIVEAEVPVQKNSKDLYVSAVRKADTGTEGQKEDSDHMPGL